MVILVFLLSCLYLLPFINLYQGGDEGYLLTGAQRLLRGEALYRDFYHFLAPGAFIFLAFLFKLFGTHFLVARLATLLTGALLAALTYLLGEKLLKNRYLALLPPFMVLVAGFPDWFLYSHHWLSSLLALGAVYLVVLGEEFTLMGSEGDRTWLHPKTPWFYFAAGLLAAVTLAVMQSKGLLIILAILVYVIFFSSFFLAKNLRFYLAGTLTGLTVLLIYLLSFGSVSGFFYYTLIWPFTHYTHANAVPYFNLGKEMLWQSLGQQKEALLHPTPLNLLRLLFYASENLFLLILGYLSILAIPAAFFWGIKTRHNKSSGENGSYLCLYALAAFAFFLSSWHRPDILHLIYGASLPLILFFFLFKKGLLSSTIFITEEKTKYRKLLPALGFLILLLIGINTLSRAEDNLLKRFRHPHFAIETPHGRQWTDIATYAQDYNFLIPFLKKRLKPQEPFLVMHYQPIIYYFLNAHNPTDTDYFYPEHNSREQFQRILETIKQKNIRFIIKDRFLEGIISGKDAAIYPYADLEVYRQEPVNRYVEENYLPVLVLNHFTLYQRK